MLPQPEPGVVVRYNFLWHREAEVGRDAAGKARPCAIVTSVRRSNDKTYVTVVPITHSPPHGDDDAIEIPIQIKQSLGLDEARSWIVTRELNTFVWPGADLEPIGSRSRSFAYGRLPRNLLIAVIRSVLAHVRSGQARSTLRTE